MAERPCSPPVRRFHGESGLAALEMAIMLPLILLLFWGVAELSRLFIIHQKLDKLANAMADYATQGATLSRGDLDTFARAADQIMSPFAFNGTIVFTGVVNLPSATPPCAASANIPCVWWQYRARGNLQSMLGAPGGAPAFSVPYTVSPGQQVIAAEAYYFFEPLLNFNGIETFTGAVAPVLVPQRLYKAAIYKPRVNSVVPLNP